MPAVAIDAVNRLWCTKGGNTRNNKEKKPYLFSHKALAKVFRGKLLDAITDEGLALPASTPKKWVVHCKSVGTGEKALVYLVRYLYRGVIQEKDIVSGKEGKVTFRYQDSETKQWVFRTVSGARFLWLVLQHVLPRGFRRARNFGFLHPNSKRLIRLLQWLIRLDPTRALARVKKRPLLVCPCCGAKMKIIETRLPPRFSFAFATPGGT